MAQTRITNTDIKKPLTQENITLGSGVNILNIVSGINNIGSAALPMGTIYADHIIGTGIGGDFVHVTGGSMSGSLNMGSGANVLSNPSGSSNVGSPSLPFNNIYANNLTIGGQSLADVFVNVSGDTMTGPLAISSGNLSLSNGSLSLTNGTITSSGNITTTAGGVIITYPGLLLARGIQPAPGGGGISLYDTAGSGGVIDVLAGSNMSGAGGKIFLESQQGSGIAGVIKLTAGAGVVTFSGQTFTLSNALNLLTAVSGGSNIGSPTVPFGNIYAQNLVGPTGGFLNIAGGQMDGTLNFATGIGITFDGSGTSNIGEPGFPVGTLYVNNIVSTGSTGEFVNITGDTMTGDLNIQTRLNVGSGNTLFGTNSSVFGTNSIASGNNSVAFGDTGQAIGGGSLALGAGPGYGRAEGAGSVALGGNAYGDGSFAQGYSFIFPSEAWLAGAVALGHGAVASGIGAFAGGDQSRAMAQGATAFGDGSEANGTTSFAVGDNSFANGISSIAMGSSSTAMTDNSIAIGNGTNASGNGAFAIGFGAEAFGDTAVSIGQGSQSNGDNSFSLGNGATTHSPNSFAIGQGSDSTGDNSFAIGNGATTNGADSFALGQSATTTTGNSMVLAFTNGVYLDSANLYPLSSGTQDIGSASLPFSGVYAKFINTKVIVTSVYNEVPSGLINGSNLAYTLLFSPYGNSLQLFKNGLYMSVSGLGIATTDCSLSGSTITFITAPASGSSLVANYNYLT